MLPLEGTFLVESICKAEKRDRLVWKQSYYDEPVSLFAFESWVKGENEGTHWSQFPWPTLSDVSESVESGNDLDRGKE